MADRTLTAANSVVTLTFPGLFPSPVQLQGYATDRAWQTGKLVMAETVRGVDGKKSAGWVANNIPQTYSLQADSLSKDVFSTVIRAQNQAREVIACSGTIDLPATGESFNCVNGTLTEVDILPGAAKLLEAQEYIIVWESITPTIS